MTLGLKKIRIILILLFSSIRIEKKKREFFSNEEAQKNFHPFGFNLQKIHVSSLCSF